MGKSKLPEHMLKQYGTFSNWKKVKRAELRAIIKMAEQLYTGSAYLPKEINLKTRELSRILQGLKADFKKW